MSNLARLEMLMAVKKLGRRRPDSSSGSEVGGSEGRSGFKGIHRFRRRLLRNPHCTIKRDKKKIMANLGLRSTRQCWEYHDHSRRLVGSKGRVNTDKTDQDLDSDVVPPQQGQGADRNRNRHKKKKQGGGGGGGAATPDGEQ